jgi:hypothetical protein
MKEITIHSPIWKSRSVGIAEYQITEDLCIEIDYRKKDGTWLYPKRFTIEKERALTYPTQIVRGGVVLRIIPISDLKEITDKEAVCQRK